MDAEKTLVEVGLLDSEFVKESDGGEMTVLILDV
jgi:hypothetical protein